MKKKKLTFSQRFKHLKKFKGIEGTILNETSCVIYDNKLVGVGLKFKTKGKTFRILFQSTDLKDRAWVTQRKCNGTCRISGYILGDGHLAVRSVWDSIPSFMKAGRLAKKRDDLNYHEYLRNNIGQAFTGYHRSGDTRRAPLVVITSSG